MSDAQPPEAEEIVPGLTNPRALGLERFLIRLRGGAATQSAWRLFVASEEGQGAIVMVEIPGQGTFYRAEGTFLGWPQDRMESAYRALLPKDSGGSFDLAQLG